MTRGLFIERPMEHAEAFATPEELASAASFGSERRRCEYLAWRAVVRRELGSDARIAYDDCGAPRIVDHPLHIGVAHCSGYVAVCISEARCAVDIELLSRDFSRAMGRYITAEEQALSSDSRWPGVVWCAKETLYKYSGRRGLDFLCDLQICSADLAKGELTGRIENGEPVGLSVRCTEEYIAVFIL